ncbi:hypothetical protein A2480_02960 [Candidatus Uhrbacteria bacterium RIFOXYC2_FULL_47_19]|uniref:Uncharacterized protein n=1 Tax=Candidatus Uhrbacteria bacterium RIFOXYC2_FULL_47_19 TaxID=1802424 RepID=A0A1F7WE59_9BACT|nr:MAG: hypothetical protein A2480_02960 [Candidatus Uhrbacteria bacterium RIFOXYC2_FULL_47_19]HCC22311.1 hypothetical protein [Candidatus Uhrbacteria bacterium]
MSIKKTTEKSSEIVVNVLAFLRDLGGTNFVVELLPEGVCGFVSLADGYDFCDSGLDRDEMMTISALHGYRPLPSPRSFLGLESFIEWINSQESLSWSDSE